jgi:hypothetical protein
MSYEIGKLIELRLRATRAREEADDLLAEARQQIETSRALVIRSAELIGDTKWKSPSRPAFGS